MRHPIGLISIKGGAAPARIGRRPRAALGVLALIACTALAEAQAPQGIVPFVVVGDAIPEPLLGKRGDAGRGRAQVFDQDKGNCVICHPVPGGDARFQGNVGPTLAGVAARLSEGQIRLRVVDQRRINPSSIMPAYHSIDGHARVGAPWRGRPVLAVGEIEDIVAFLLTLKE